MDGTVQPFRLASVVNFSDAFGYRKKFLDSNDRITLSFSLVITTVVDRASSVRAVLRADNAGAHTLASTERKAFTAASMRVPTQMLMETAQKNPGAANLVYLPGLLLLGGGVPVKAGNEVIGGVGVGGAPTGQIDEQCALAGIDKVKDLLK